MKKILEGGEKGSHRFADFIRQKRNYTEGKVEIFGGDFWLILG